MLKSAGEIIDMIGYSLDNSSGDMIQQIAMKVLDYRVKYKGDSIFELQKKY